ncbi:BCCT family transporter [Oceanobacillus oncorhynchi subsp. oncorhynchi]|uniref:BCCT family transporter n=1 Tax=Oceanobacillus TaxID=182709 RepID=UPI0030D82FBA
MKKRNKNFLNPVFFISASVILALVIIGAFNSTGFQSVATRLFDLTTQNFGWLYLISVFVFVLFLIGLSISKYGKIKLGSKNSKPEFGFFPWIGMLFSTGFGSGLVFWGVAEPMSHFFDTPFPGLEPQTEEAARVAMGYAFFNWGISQWSVFALVGLVIAYLQFRKGKDGLISTAVKPVVGNNLITATSINSLAVIATVMGVATSLGLGIMQMSGGLSSVFGLPDGVWVQITIALAMLLVYLGSSVSGLNRGMKWLSSINLSFCLILLVFVFLMGPTVFILETFVLGLGDYLTNFVEYSLRLTPYTGDNWVMDWTIFYWAWAISWSPFVGAFVARVSRGRTIRQYIFGVLVTSPAIACIWIAVFGGTSLYSDLMNGTMIAEAVDHDLAVALFETFGTLPLSTITSLMAIILIFTFLVTSADSATYILGSMTSKGSLNPALITKFIWGGLITAIAVVLLVAGGLEALQTASLTSALPFVIIIIMLMISFIKILQREENDKLKN